MLIHRIVNGAGIFVNRRGAFLFLMGAAVVTKLIASAVFPASNDLSDIVAFAGPGNPAPFGPWMTLEVGIFNMWRSSTSSTITGVDWSMTPPATMPFNLALLSLILRVPAFSFDLGIAIVLYFMVAKLASVNEARFAALLWFLNPYTIFTIELLGVPDVAAAFFTLCTVACLANKRTFLAALFYAFGIALKLYPILLLPPLLIYLSKRIEFGNRAKGLMALAGLAGLAGYISWVFPGGAANLLLYEYSPVTQPLSLYIPYQPSFARVSAATIFLVLLYFATWYFANSPNITDWILPVLLIYFTFSYLYPQYLIWALPFLTLDIVVLKRSRALLLTALLSCVFLYWFISSAGLSTPSGYSLLMFPLTGHNLPQYSRALTSFLTSTLTGFLILPIIQSTLYAVSFVYALEIIRGWLPASVKAALGDQSVRTK